MDGRPLDHFELLSIAEKDEQYYKKWLGDNVQDISQRLLGVRTWIRFRNVITVLSRFGYFAAPILFGKTTPGEEFCEAHHISNISLPSRLATILLNNELQLPREIPQPYAKLLKDIHLITYFMCGDFYELAKRATGYSYLTGDMNSYQSQRMTYWNRFVGCLSIVRLFIDTLTQSRELDIRDDPKSSLLETPQSETPAPKMNLDANTICQLCSEVRKEPTSALCGHIFCWHCIHQWLKERSECPICRAPTEPSRLVHLINFK